MNIESFTYQPHELAAQLTQNTHQTLHWLYTNNYLSEEDYLDLDSRLVVTPIKNTASWGKRLLARLFEKGSETNDYQFPISTLPSVRVKNESQTKTTSPE